MNQTARFFGSLGRGGGLGGGLAILSLVLVAFLVLPGCNIVGMFGAMEESRRRSSTEEKKAEYTQMEGKKWAVLVSADRSIQADNPQLVDRLTLDLTRRLIEGSVGASARPGEDVLRFQYNNPRWVTMNYGELASKLGVERLIVVELLEYRLYEPGNKYIYSGMAQARLGVIESGSAIADEFAFQKQVSIKYPVKDGTSISDIPVAGVNTELARRLATRISWFFFDHEEPYYPEF